MAETPPTPEDRRRAWTLARVAGALGVLAIIFALAVIAFRGCHQAGIEEEMLDPGEPLPGTEETIDLVALRDALPRPLPVPR
jgi:hypothetical protein